MELTLRSFLLLLRKLVSFFRKRWDQSTRGLWYIFAFLRSRYSSQQEKKGDKIRRNLEPRPPNPPTTVICASRLPPSLTPIAGGDTPVITSPTPIPINIRKPTILDHEDPLYEAQENYSTDHLGVDNYYLEGSGTISRSHNPASHRNEREYTRIILSPGQEDSSSNSPVIPSLPASRPPSQYAGYRPPSQYSYRPPSEHSYRSAPHLNGAESAARGYLHGPPRPPSPTLSVRAPSVAGSVTHRPSRPTTRVRIPSLRNTSRRRGGSSTPASARQSIYEGPPEAPPLPQAESIGPHYGPAPNPKGRLRPMIGINRYENHRKVVIKDAIEQYTCPPVTTQFVR